MNADIGAGPALYNDFNGLARLRAGAARQDERAGIEAARQFEALFVQMMLKSMRDAASVFAENSDTTYQEMFDRQIATELTRERGIGLLPLLTRQLGLSDAEQPAPAVRASSLSVPSAASMPGSSRIDWRPQSSGDFLSEIWPHAQRAGRRLGVNPAPIAAQAALETGWGQHLIRDNAGISGNNLFGIKAGSDWQGEKLAVGTFEFIDGMPVRERARFRAYPDLAAGFDDYVNFLLANPRYADATRGGLSDVDYVNSLQAAGYATDPQYAEKIQRVMRSDIFATASQRLAAAESGSESR